MECMTLAEIFATTIFFRKTHARLYLQISMRVCRLQRPTKWVRHVQLGRVRRDPIFQQWQEQRDWSEHRLLRHPWRACVDRHQDGPRDVILRYAAAEIHLLQGPSDRGHQEHPHIRPQSIHSYSGRWIGKNSDTFNNKSRIMIYKGMVYKSKDFLKNIRVYQYPSAGTFNGIF